MSDKAAEAPKRALIVVDVQNDYDKGGNLAIQFPPFQDTVKNVARAMDAAREANVKVVVIKQLAPETSPIFAKGSHGAELHPEIAKRPRDHYVEKKLPSAFTGTDLEYWLRSNRIDTVTIAGYMTHNCNLSTVVHATHMGFDVEFLSDASGSVPYANSAGHASAEELHRVITIIFQSRFAAVTRTQDWIEGLKTGRLPQRDSIPASYRRALAKHAA